MSSGGDVKYTQSPEQRSIMRAAMPLYQGLTQYGQQRYFGGAPNMGAPSMQGVLTNVPMYNMPGHYTATGETAPGWAIPDPSMAMPTGAWYNSLAPEVKTGLYAPYMETGQQLLETMGSKGQGGSARGGYSGAAGVAMGKLAGEAAKNVGLSAWQMTAPAASAAWQAQLGRNQALWGEDLARNKLGYNQALQERMGDFSTAMDVWQRPFGTLGMMGMGMPSAYMQEGGSLLGGAGAGLMGGGMGYLAAASNPLTAPYALPMAGLMGLGGLLGGK